MSRKGFKLVILDEADMMTQAAQGALRRGQSKFHTSLSPTLFFLEEDRTKETVIDENQGRNDWDKKATIRAGNDEKVQKKEEEETKKEEEETKKEKERNEGQES